MRMTSAVRPLGGPEQSAGISGDVGVLNLSALMKGRLGAWRASINSQRYFSLRVFQRQIKSGPSVIQHGSESLAAQ